MVSIEAILSNKKLVMSRLFTRNRVVLWNEFKDWPIISMAWQLLEVPGSKMVESKSILIIFATVERT